MKVIKLSKSSIRPTKSGKSLTWEDTGAFQVYQYRGCVWIIYTAKDADAKPAEIHIVIGDEDLDKVQECIVEAKKVQHEMEVSRLNSVIHHFENEIAKLKQQLKEK